MTSFITLVPIQIDTVKIANLQNTAVLPLGSTNVKGIAYF